MSKGQYNEVVPVIDTEIFQEFPNKKFAITNLQQSPTSEDEVRLVEAYHRLRANVYIDELGILDIEAQDRKKQEIDQDDDRSEHFVVIENRLGGTAVVACLRLIDFDNERPLPVEQLFPDVFSQERAEATSIEVSRFITRYEDKKTRHVIRDLMFASALAHIDNANKGPAYAIVERELETHLAQKVGVPLERLTEYQWIEEYSTENATIRIDTVEMVRRFGRDAIKTALLEQGEYRYWGEVAAEQELERRVG